MSTSNARAVKVSRYMSYLLRHDPQDLKMDRHGFVEIDELLKKLRQRFRISREFILDVAEKRDRKRFEILGSKIRAMYGHTIPVELELEEDKTVKTLYHGTTPEAASMIQKEGLKPMKRRWVHLSPTKGIAVEVGKRRTSNPVILKIDVEAARKSGLRFFRATDKVFVCGPLLPRYIALMENASH